MDQQRRWALLGVFGGAVGLIAIWLVASSDSADTHNTARGVAAPRGKGKMKAPIGVPSRTADVARIHAHRDAVPIDPSLIPGATAVPPPKPNLPAGVHPLDQTGIADAVQAEMSELEACYETALFHTPGLTGSMILEMKVTPVEGEKVARVESVHVESDVDATVFEGCVATVFEDLRFSATEATTVRYPLTFDAGEEPGEGAEPAEGAGDAPEAGAP